MNNFLRWKQLSQLIDNFLWKFMQLYFDNNWNDLKNNISLNKNKYNGLTKVYGNFQTFEYSTNIIHTLFFVWWNIFMMQKDAFCQWHIEWKRITMVTHGKNTYYVIGFFSISCSIYTGEILWNNDGFKIDRQTTDVVHACNTTKFVIWLHG